MSCEQDELIAWSLIGAAFSTSSLRFCGVCDRSIHQNYKLLRQLKRRVRTRMYIALFGG